MTPTISKLLSDINTRLLVFKEVLTMDEAAQYIGVSGSEMMEIVKTKKLPYCMPYRKYMFFKRTEINEWLMKESANGK